MVQVLTRTPLKDADKYVEEVIRWRRGERPEEQPEDSESAWVGVDTETVAATIAARGESKKLITEDKEELVGFLGFDPGFPETLGGVYQSESYETIIGIKPISVMSWYRDKTREDTRATSVRMYFYSAARDIDISFEQNEEGEYVTIDGISVYRYANGDHNCYLWTENLTVVRLLTELPYDEADGMVEEVIRWRRGERPEEQPVKQLDDTGAGHEIDGDVVAEVIERHGGRAAFPLRTGQNGWRFWVSTRVSRRGSGTTGQEIFSILISRLNGRGRPARTSTDSRTNSLCR